MQPIHKMYPEEVHRVLPDYQSRELYDWRRAHQSHMTGLSSRLLFTIPFILRATETSGAQCTFVLHIYTEHLFKQGAVRLQYDNTSTSTWSSVSVS